MRRSIIMVMHTFSYIHFLKTLMSWFINFSKSRINLRIRLPARWLVGINQSNQSSSGLFKLQIYPGIENLVNKAHSDVSVICNCFLSTSLTFLTSPVLLKKTIYKIFFIACCFVTIAGLGSSSKTHTSLSWRVGTSKNYMYRFITSYNFRNKSVSSIAKLFQGFFADSDTLCFLVFC